MGTKKQNETKNKYNRSKRKEKSRKNLKKPQKTKSFILYLKYFKKRQRELNSTKNQSKKKRICFKPCTLFSSIIVFNLFQVSCCLSRDKQIKKEKKEKKKPVLFKKKKKKKKKS